MSRTWLPCQPGSVSRTRLTTLVYFPCTADRMVVPKGFGPQESSKAQGIFDNWLGFAFSLCMKDNRQELPPYLTLTFCVDFPGHKPIFKQRLFPHVGDKSVVDRINILVSGDDILY